MNPKIATRRITLLLLLFTLCAVTTLAQTSVFTYQGRLTDGGTAANGTYDLQFVLFDTVSGGAQIATQTVPTVLVSGGIFTVQLDFGANAFPGANRWHGVIHDPLAATADHFDALRDSQLECFVGRCRDGERRAWRQRQLHSERDDATAECELQHQRQRDSGRYAFS
jgi:hypothetical protein